MRQKNAKLGRQARKQFCPFFWAILFIGNMIFNYGLLPSTVVLIIWGVLQMSYMLEALKLGKGQNT